jgi:hypothetical protein
VLVQQNSILLKARFFKGSCNAAMNVRWGVYAVINLVIVNLGRNRDGLFAHESSVQSRPRSTRSLSGDASRR